MAGQFSYASPTGRQSLANADAPAHRARTGRPLRFRFPAVWLVAADAARFCGIVRTDRPCADVAPRVRAWLVVCGWAILHRPQLDRDRLYIPGGDAGMAWLDRSGRTVALPSNLSDACHRPCVAHRARPASSAGPRFGRRVDRQRMAARDDVHRLCVEPGRGDLGQLSKRVPRLLLPHTSRGGKKVLAVHVRAGPRARSGRGTTAGRRRPG